MTVGSRKSDLALWQAYEVLRLLRASSPTARFLLQTELSSGDIDLVAPLATLASASPGVFTKELEVALLARRVDLAVHSLKDMPTSLPAGLALVGISARGDARDAVVLSPHAIEDGARGLADLPAGARVGTSSLRRAAFLARAYPSLVAENVRGNVGTRLRKLEGDGALDALLLAAAGLDRLALGARAAERLAPTDCPYGVGQGALGIEARADDERAASLGRAVTHAPTAVCVLAERAFLRAMGAGCQVPLGVEATLERRSVGALRGGEVSAQMPADVGDAGDDEDSDYSDETPLVRTLVLTGTVSSLDGAATIAATVREVVSIPRAGSLRRRVDVRGLDAARAAADEAADAGEKVRRLGVTREGWDALISDSERVGLALAARIIAAGGSAFISGEPRPITYGAAEQPLDR